MDFCSLEQDNLILLSTFPEEVWHQILRNMHTSNDFTNISQSSPTFKNLLVPHRTRLLFGEVLPFLKLYCGYNRYNRLHDFLSLRLVCHAWKIGLDNCVETPSTHLLFSDSRDWGFYPGDPRPRSRQVGTRHFESSERVASFCNEFDGTHLPRRKNPFVGRNIDLVLDVHLPTFAEFLRDTLAMLQIYGHHIWYCRVTMVVGDRAPTSAALGNCAHLRDNLLLVPSLRRLTLGFETTRPVGEHMREIEEYWGSEDVPRFPNLQMISEDGCTPLPILLALLKANAHVKVLETRALNMIVNPTVYETTLPRNLEKLNISFEYPTQLETFESALITCAFLTTLRIHTAITNTQLSELMSVVESKFGNTLKNLFVSYHGYTNRRLPVEPLIMPRLETFHLQMLHFQPIDFLCTVPTLEKVLLELYNQGQHNPVHCVGTENYIEFFEHRRNPEQSNIWEVLPKLKLLGCLMREDDPRRWYKCTREQWKKNPPVSACKTQ